MKVLIDSHSINSKYKWYYQFNGQKLEVLEEMWIPVFSDKLYYVWKNNHNLIIDPEDCLDTFSQREKKLERILK